MSSPHEDVDPASGGDSLRVIGRYEILRALATGGMAEVFVARAHGIEGFQKVIVIKRLRPEIAADPEFVRMFLDEARVLATLQHANIVQIFDVGEIDNSYFFTMELLRGEDIRGVVKRARAAGGRVPLEHALHIMMSALAGLHCAHQKAGPDGKPLGIVHRDVSPSNILVTYDGDVKVIDFGIAKTTVQSTQTRAGMVKGKLRYMSPEQCRSHPLDRRSDIFSAAVVLWEMTTGRRLFSGNDYDTMRQIVESDAQRPSEIVPDYPPELERIVMKALRRDPDERYATAQEMQVDLDAFAREERLSASALALGRYMTATFADKVAAWTEAEGSGQAFVAHIGAVIEGRHGTDPKHGPASLTGQTAPSPGVVRPSQASSGTANVAVAQVLDAPRQSGRSVRLAAGGAVVVAAVGALAALVLPSRGTLPSAASAADVGSSQASTSPSAAPPASAAAPPASAAAEPTPPVSASAVAEPGPPRKPAASPPARAATPARRSPPPPARSTPPPPAPAKTSWDKDSPLLPP